MEPKAIDPADFRAAQHEHWDAAAVGWMQWSAFNDRADKHISERLVELAGVQSGSRVLDVAAGYGEPALTAARRAGPEGRVVATDISAEMLAFGRERATAAGLGNVEFIQSDASGLDFGHATFDAAVSRWGIIFEPDAEAAARRIRGFLKPGARMAISSWGTPDQVPFLSIPMRTTMKRLNVPPPPAGTPGPLSRPTPAAIGALLEGGGFSKIAVEQDEVTFAFDSPAHFTAYVRAISAPIRAMIEQHAGDAQEEAWAAITQAASDAWGDSKPLSVSNVVLLASASA
ncbi:MAG TPA: methyltransferase domain-containing protein [Solirubrobacteraceae bacterium]|jgi:SAM-dependent methyltransferase|nr:methyltransferase domain-containing protein [Solirubrobacteraceae bacterium]